MKTVVFDEIKWQLVPIEPSATRTRAGQLGITTTCTNAIYSALLAAAEKRESK